MEYLLVEQEPHRAELFRKQPDGRWITQAFAASEDLIRMESIGAELRLAEIYSKPPSAEA